MWPFLTALIAAYLVTPLVIWLYKQHNWLDNPNQHKHVKVVHTQPVPRGGGLVIFSTVLLLSAWWLQFDSYLITIMLGAVILTIVGWLDDIYDIHPLIRLGSGLLAALLVVSSGIGIDYVTNPFGSGVIHLDSWQVTLPWLAGTKTFYVWADLFAIIFILWNMNIVNWAKGVDGQLPGFVSIALIFVGLLSYKFIDDPTQFNTAYLAFIVAGAFAGFGVWNFYPQKIMPGYGAGSLAGYFLAVLSILSGAKVATTIMVLGVPTADAIFTIARRLRAGKLPWWGDRGHLHHKLLDILGWGKRRIAIFYWTTTLLLGLLALNLNTQGKMVTMVVVMALVFGFLIWAKQRSLAQKN